MNCIIIGGFLGSGKTTFINDLLKRAALLPAAVKTALLINEFGEIPVDSAMMDEGSYSMREITGGCICCSLKGMLADAVAEIRQNEKPDLLIVEATGLAVPSEIAASVGAAAGSSVFTLLCVDSAQHQKLAGKLAIYDRQLADADVVLLTKEDLRSTDLMRAAAEELAGGKERSVRCTDNCEDASEIIFNCFPKKPEPALTAVSGYVNSEHHEHHHENEKHELKQDICQVTRTLVKAVEPKDLRKILADLAEAAGPDLFRIKGIVRSKAGWIAVQFADGVLHTRPADEPDNEAFLVFIGMCSQIKDLTDDLEKFGL